MIYNQATNETKELEDCYGLFSFSFEKNYFMCSGKNGINLFDSNLKLVSIIGENVAFTDPSRKAFYFFNKDTKVVFSGKDSALYMYEIPSGKLIKKWMVIRIIFPEFPFQNLKNLFSLLPSMEP